MPMPRINPAKIAKLYNERIAFLMRGDAFGRKVRYFYPPIETLCPNCILSGSGASSGRYKLGGPIPFENSVCPYCLGKGVFQEAAEEEGILIVLFDAQQWFQPAQSAMLPDNSAMIIGDRKSEWNKLIRCTRMILNTDVYNDGDPYVKAGEPYPVGLFNSTDQSGSRWFYCYVKRDGGG